MFVSLIGLIGFAALPRECSVPFINKRIIPCTFMPLLWEFHFIDGFLSPLSQSRQPSFASQTTTAFHSPYKQSISQTQLLSVFQNIRFIALRQPDIFTILFPVIGRDTSLSTYATMKYQLIATGAVLAPLAAASDVTISDVISLGKKAGLSGYVGIQEKQAFSDLSPYISWYSDYNPDTPSSGDVKGIGMLWGADGSGCGDEVTDRVNRFNDLISTTTPEIMFGFFEPDCSCPDSSAMTTDQGQAAWNSMLAPLKSKGTVLGSPSMCKQKDEDWLTPFKGNIAEDWDITSVHINKPDMTGVMADIEYYAAKYGKPIWVSEFACVNDQNGFVPCTDQGQINQFINDCVEFFQNNDTVVAYGPSNGNGLGDVWPLTNSDGNLSESGTTYLNAIKGL